MPWKTSSVVDERTRFILEYESDELTMTELCEVYNISRETGYYWLRQYQHGGLEVLQGGSRAAKRHPNQTSKEIQEAVLAQRYAHMRWGPRKLKRVLEQDRPDQVWPAASTIGALLWREGLVVGARSDVARRLTRSLLPRPMRRTGSGARISKGILKLGMARGSIH